MSTIWFTSDLHLSHRLVAKLRFPCMVQEGFSDEDILDKHDGWLKDMWKVVGKRDQVFILGDITLRHERHGLKWLSQFPGRKHLIAGNHDPVFAQHSDYRAALKRWHDSGVFDTIQQHGTVKVAGEKLLMSHFPYLRVGDRVSKGGVKYQQWRLPDYGALLLHGHTLFA